VKEFNMLPRTTNKDPVHTCDPMDTESNPVSANPLNTITTPHHCCTVKRRWSRIREKIAVQIAVQIATLEYIILNNVGPAILDPV
jgi:hypothetical protein